MSRLQAGQRHAVRFTLNGSRCAGEAEPRMLLTDFLRHGLGATGTHVGCEHGVCGACTVEIDGAPARACLTLAVQVEGCEVRTVEGLAPAPGRLAVLQAAFRRHHALQCGFCTAGILMSLDAFLRDHPRAGRGRDPRGARRPSVPLHRLCADRRAALEAAAELAARQREDQMLDLGTSFIASVARDPARARDRRWRHSADLRAMVCADLRRWSPRFDGIGLKPGDHLVTVLQNR